MPDETFTRWPQGTPMDQCLSDLAIEIDELRNRLDEAGVKPDDKARTALRKLRQMARPWKAHGYTDREKAIHFNVMCEGIITTTTLALADKTAEDVIDG